MLLETFITAVIAAGSLYSLTDAAPALDNPSLHNVEEKQSFFPNNQSLQMRGLRVTSSITARFAKTVVTSHVVNPANQSQEVNFYMELPREAFISGFLIETEGKVYRSTVDEKEKAQKAYDHAKSQGQTAGQVRQTSREKNDFTVSINVAGGGALSFNLTFEELLKRKDGYFENSISISPGEIVEHLIVDVHINEPQGIDEEKIDYFVKIRSSDGNTEVLRPLWAEMKQLGHDRANMQFHPTAEEQAIVSPEGNLGKFVVRYDVIHGQNAGNIEIVNGYFVHHFSPEGFSPISKNVVFVLDTSGSMSGTKIRQTKEAMETILSDLREQDHFGIITFASSTRTWRPTLVPADKVNVEAAKERIRSLHADGGTDLHGGIIDAITMLESSDLSTVGVFSFIVMLTDGQPTSGVTNLNTIKSNIRQRLEGRFSLFCLGFGNNVDYRFLEQLSLQNRGLARKIYEDSDASLQLVGFFDEVATPLLANVEIKYDDNMIVTNSISQTVFPTFFDGTELVVAGKLAANDSLPNVLTCVVTAESTDIDIELQLEVNVKEDSEAILSPHAVDDFAQRLWAFLTIKELLRKRSAADEDDEKANLTERALELSLKYHFVTPLTSLVVIKPDEEPVIQGEDTEPEREDEDSLPPLSLQPRQHYSPPGARLHSGFRNVIAVGRPWGRQVQGTWGRPLLRPTAKPIALLPISTTTQSTTAYDSTTTTHTSTSKKTTRAPSPTRSTTDASVTNRQVSAMLETAFQANIHFLIHDEQNNVTLCFGAQVEPGDVLKLIEDPVFGLVFRGELASAYRQSSERDPTALIFSRLQMKFLGSPTVLVSAEFITSGPTLIGTWDTNWNAKLDGGLTLALTEGKYLTIQPITGITLVVTRHVERLQKNKYNYLGFDVVNDEGFSDSVEGLIGSYIHKEIYLEEDSITEDEGHGVKGNIRVGGQQVKVSRSEKSDIRDGVVKQCWYTY